MLRKQAQKDQCSKQPKQNFGLDKCQTQPVVYFTVRKNCCWQKLITGLGIPALQSLLPAVRTQEFTPKMQSSPFSPASSSLLSHQCGSCSQLRLFMNLHCHCLGTRFLRSVLVWTGSLGRETGGGLWKTGFPPGGTVFPPTKASSCDMDVWCVLVPTLWPTLLMSHKRQ